MPHATNNGSYTGGYISTHIPIRLMHMTCELHSLTRQFMTFIFQTVMKISISLSIRRWKRMLLFILKPVLFLSLLIVIFLTSQAYR